MDYNCDLCNDICSNSTLPSVVVEIHGAEIRFCYNCQIKYKKLFNKIWELRGYSENNNSNR